MLGNLFSDGEWTGRVRPFRWMRPILLVTLITALVAEAMASIPKRPDDEEEEETAAPASPASGAPLLSVPAPSGGGSLPRRDDDWGDEEGSSAPASGGGEGGNRPSRGDDDWGDDSDGDDSSSSSSSSSSDDSSSTSAISGFAEALLSPPPPRPPVGPDEEQVKELVARNKDIQPEEAYTKAPAAEDRACIACHPGISDPHTAKHSQFPLGCVKCHGGNGDLTIGKWLEPGSAVYVEKMFDAHVQPAKAEEWLSSANPSRSYADFLQEEKEFVRFVNPGDLRVAGEACGDCHTTKTPHVYNVSRSMMNHGAMLWGAALYNNGGIQTKTPRYGMMYTAEGKPATLQTYPPPTLKEIREKGVLPFLEPIPRWEVAQPGNILRVFERGSRRKLETGLPALEEDPGKPDKGLSPRGLGTLNRTDPVFLGLQKTRLHNPTLGQLGTNDHPGDFRSSGCTSCHMIYANDRDPMHSAWAAKHGHLGMSQTADPTIPKDEKGHPIKHKFTNAIPSSQCMVCHMHPGTNVLTTYFGYLWWDDETDGEHMYPKKSKVWKPEEKEKQLEKNPTEASLKGKWSDPKFLENLKDLNPKLKNTQFADFNGHGWVFRGVFKKDDKGELVDKEGKKIDPDDPDKWMKAVHLKDIHLEKGMHCIDCHFTNDVHGNGKLYGEVRAAIEITCEDCHGTIDRYAYDELKTSGPAAPDGGNSLKAFPKTPYGQRRFEKTFDANINAYVLKQRSMVTEGIEWTVVQTRDTVDPRSAFYNKQSSWSKTVQKDAKTWGVVPEGGDKDALIAHLDTKISCFTCHTAWMTSCFGCHLSMRANKRKPNLHNEGTHTRNWTGYNYQVIRDDVFMMGQDGAVMKNKISPVRSSSAVVVSSQNQNREWIYHQQQTFSAEGYSGQTFNTHVPHTVRSKETKQCTDCHLGTANDNNAKLAQLTLQGTNFVNFFGRYIYVAEGKHGFEAVAVTEHEEPQAVTGSHLHGLAYPEKYKAHIDREMELEEAHEHKGENILSIQQRGEYVYTANGEGGFEVFDVAQIDHKGFSEKIVSAPVSPWGQRTYVRTKFATAVALPSTLYVHVGRPQNPENMERPPHPLYKYAYITDKFEGLILVDTMRLYDGDPMNNFFERALTWNPDGVLDGAQGITIAGNHAYITTPWDLVIVSIEDPLNPKVVKRMGAKELNNPRKVEVQFRYAFVADDDGLKVMDITIPEKAHFVPGAKILLPDGAKSVYLARTYAYVAAGSHGVAIIDIKNPEKPRLEQVFDADGQIVDANDVKVGMTNASVFAYVADGEGGLKVIEMMSPDRTPGHGGYSPTPTPKLIAWFKTAGHALHISEGIDRDRAVDESGNQIAVFGRKGSGPLTADQVKSLYLKNGEVYTVTDQPTTDPAWMTEEVKKEAAAVKAAEAKSKKEHLMHIKTP